MVGANLRELVRRVRSGERLRPLICLAATLASLAVFGGLGLLGGWLFGMTRTNAVVLGTVGDVRGIHIGVGLAVAGVLCAIVIGLIWRRAVRLRASRMRVASRRSLAPVLVSGIVVSLVTFGSYLVERQSQWDDRELAVWALLALGVGAILVAWLPAVYALEAGPVLGADDSVNVQCPRCGYSMVGLREALCPECGAGYTIDGLIVAQGYGDRDNAQSPSPPVP